MLELETRLKQEVQELLRLGEQVDQGEVDLPEGLIVENEVTLRAERLAKLAEAKAVLEVRAQERYQVEKVEYDAKMQERTKKAASVIESPKDVLLNPQSRDRGTRTNTTSPILIRES